MRREAGGSRGPLAPTSLTALSLKGLTREQKSWAGLYKTRPSSGTDARTSQSGKELRGDLLWQAPALGQGPVREPTQWQLQGGLELTSCQVLDDLVQGVEDAAFSLKRYLGLGKQLEDVAVEARGSGRAPGWAQELLTARGL